MSSDHKPSVDVATFSVLAILAISLLLQHEFALKQSLLFLVGVGLGISLLHALFGFTGGWRFFIRDRNSMGVRAQIILLMLTSLVFFPIVSEKLQ